MSPDLPARLDAAFRTAYGTPPAFTVRAPGRVNLIGEHTDYNGGFVLPCAIDYETRVAVRPRADRRLRVVAADWGAALDEFALDDEIAQRADAPWANYVRGVAWALQERGAALRGGDLAIAGNVPQGAGLSSSAALEVALGLALRTLMGDDDPQAAALDPTQLALVGQRAENAFVGIHCGIMDQLIAARGEAGHALLIDCRSLQARAVPLPADLAVMVIHSRVARGLVDSAYNERRAQCEAAARHCGVALLREVDLPTLEARRTGLDDAAFRRARHIVTENQRTLDAAEALVAGDLPRLGTLMAESHASMRDDFEITVPAIDDLAGLARQAIGTDGGARMTGGGFGGCVVALMPQHRVAAVREAVLAGYRSPTGESPWVWVCRASAGVGSVS